MKIRKTVIILSVSLTVFLSLFALIHYRDRQHVILERLNPNTFVTSDLPKLLYLNAFTQDNPEFLQFIQSPAKYECLNGKDPSKLSPKEQLEEFIKGPCLPVVAVPGLLASKLSIKIDCETFQANNPDIFSKCGWTTCSGWRIWNSMPNEEYTLWISDFLGPVSILFHDTVQCWGNIIQLEYNADEPDIKQRYVSPVGVDVRVYGQSENEESKAGFSAVNNILPTPFQTLYSKGFENIYNSLVKMGYQTGLNLYATPYDWRKTTLANGVTEVLNQTVRQIYELTGKPTIIIAHSLGNFGTLHLLNTMSAEDKDKYIANFVSVTNPLAGAPKAVKTFIGGEKEYIYKKFGINYYAQRKLVKSSSGAFDVMPKNIFDYFANTPWLQEWKNRADLENNHDVKTPEGREVWEQLVKNGTYGYKWFPHPLLNCSYGFEQRRDECGLYMYNWSVQPLAVINDKTFTASENDLKSLFNEFALATNVSDYLFNDSKTNNIHLLENPGVPVTLIYGSHMSTEVGYEWDYDPRENTREDQFAFPNRTIFSQGDQTVPTTSALLPGLKWSWEYENRIKEGLPNAKPVKIVEVCSIHNNKADIYDQKHDNQPYKPTHNEYIGLSCDCFTQKNDHPVLGQNCDHSDIINDSKFVAFINKIVLANYKVLDWSKLALNLLSNEELKTIAANSPYVGSNWTKFEEIMKTKNKTVDSLEDLAVVDA